MDKEDVLKDLCQYAINKLTFEQYHSFGSPENFQEWVEENYRPIPKKELVTGKEYKGVSRNASKAAWDGEKFVFGRRKPGSKYTEQMSHFEDDKECGYDVFMPIEKINR